MHGSGCACVALRPWRRLTGEGADEGRSNEALGVKPSRAGGQGRAEGRGDAGWEEAKEVKKWDRGSWERLASLARLAQTRRLTRRDLCMQGAASYASFLHFHSLIVQNVAHRPTNDPSGGNKE